MSCRVRMPERSADEEGSVHVIYHLLRFALLPFPVYYNRICPGTIFTGEQGVLYLCFLDFVAEAAVSAAR